MHFLFLFLFYFTLSSTYGCKETEDGDLQMDTSFMDTNHLENPGQYEDGGLHMMDRQMEEYLNKMFQSGELNLKNLQEKMSALLNDPDFKILIKGFTKNTDMSGSETCGADRVIEMPHNEIGGSCGF